MNDQTSSATSVLAVGALAGLAATVPMTLFMQQMHQQLPARERYPLPPSEIIEEMIGAHVIWGVALGLMVELLLLEAKQGGNRTARFQPSGHGR
jgi:hypothetical protein